MFNELHYRKEKAKISISLRSSSFEVSEARKLPFAEPSASITDMKCLKKFLPSGMEKFLSQ